MVISRTSTVDVNIQALSPLLTIGRRRGACANAGADCETALTAIVLQAPRELNS